MSKKDIRYVTKMSEPKLRKRDGELLTHSLRIALTPTEAVAIQELFASRKGTQPTISLIRAFLIAHALEEVSEETLVSTMAKLKVKEQLADCLASADFVKAINFLKNPPELPPKKTVPSPAKVERRVFIPEPRRR